MADVRTLEWPGGWWRGTGAYDKEVGKPWGGGRYWQLYGPNRVIAGSEGVRLSAPEPGGHYLVTAVLTGQAQAGEINLRATAFSNPAGASSVGTRTEGETVAFPQTDGADAATTVRLPDLPAGSQSWRPVITSGSGQGATQTVGVERVDIVYVPPIQARAPRWTEDWLLELERNPALTLRGSTLLVTSPAAPVRIDVRDRVLMPVPASTPWLTLTAAHPSGHLPLTWSAEAEWRSAEGAVVGSRQTLGSATASGTSSTIIKRLSPPAGAAYMRLSLTLSTSGALSGITAALSAADPTPKPPQPPQPPQPPITPPKPAEELRPGWGTTGPGWGTTGPGWGRRGPGWL